MSVSTKPQQKSAAPAVPPTPYEANNYEHLIGMPGFSEKLLKTHFKLYEGYVKNTNALVEECRHLVSEDKAKTPVFAELKRRFGWEFNGMRLHEFYFDNLGGQQPLNDSSRLQGLLAANFGDYETWKADFTATGAMRGIGWAILYQDSVTGRLFNAWIDEHNTNHLAGGEPLLVLDVFEHAFMTDYGTDRASYINAFFKNINWDVVASRAI
ncbi:MAG: superoxide dismutase [Elusimicrobia bacterium]|nr:superoxide dismutase [Elusimicrobiota bacterium]